MTHTPIIARDLEAARKFYAAAARPLGLDVLEWRSGFIVGQPGNDEPLVRVRQAKGPVVSELPVTELVKIEARDDFTVRAFYRAALEAGGRQVGYPGPQPVKDGLSYYAARVEDPDGNIVECGWRY